MKIEEMAQVSLQCTVLFLCLVVPINPFIYRSSRVVNLKYGDLQGFIVKPNHHGLGNVEVFLGVPYAAAPIGDLRFMPPTTPFSWSNVRRAETMPPVCPQNLPDVSNRREALKKMPEGRYNYLQRLIPMLRNESEDCLYLNIYVPMAASSGPERLAVLVYIHGDSYEWNSGNPYDGSTLASYGQVIVITLNFRLGALGFLRPTLRDTVSNFGLLDQNAALHWIKENIVNFNGDPSKVTIFGHGTGAALANLLLISPITQLPGGIFQRAILMSGSALSKWALTWDPYKYTIQVAKALGCPLSDRGDELTRCLRSKTTVELRDVRLQTPPFTTPLGPIVDGVIIKKDPFVTMVENERVFGRYELLYGVTPAESYNVLTAAEVKFGMSLDRKNKLLRAYVSNNFNHQTSSIYSAILNQYDSYSTSKLPDERSTRDQTQEILSDAQIVAPVVNMGDLHSNLNQRSYFYVFNHQSAYGDYPVSQGTVHGEELAYVFGAPLVGGFSHFTLNYTQDEVLLSELVMKLWTNFAKTGNPNLPTPQDFLTKNASPNWVDNLRTMWPPYDRNQQLYLQLDLQIVKHSHYRARQLALWNRLIPDLVSSSGTRSDPISLFPGATPPTITLAPTVMPEYPEMFVPDKATPRPVHHQSGPRIIKPVPTKPPPTPVYPVADKEEAAAKESTQQAEVPLAGTPIQLVVGIGVVIFCVNCMIMGLIVMYYRKHKHRHESDGIKDTDSTVSANPSETSSITLIDMKGNVESERASRKSSRSVDKNSLEGISENCSRTSTLSRDSSRKRKRSQSADSTDSHDHSESKPNRSSSSGHRRNKSDNSVYIDLGKESKSKVKNEISRSGKQPSVKFNDAPVLLDNNLNRSTSSIASKSSVKSTSSRASVRSGSSRASVKIGSTAKPVRRNTSNQSLPTADYGWTAPGEVPKSVNFSNSPDDEEAENAVKKSVPIMRKRSYPKITTVPPPIDEGSSTIPRPRPPPPPRSTSLTARDIEELEKLQVTYRSTIPPCHTSSDSCEHSGSEPFYSMGGGEAPARAPGLMYGPTMVPPPENPGLNVIKNDGSDYDQYQKFQAPYSMQNPRNSSESPLPLPPSQSYLTFGDNRGPRGPLASFGKWSDPMTSSANFDVIRLSPVSPIPPPVPAHQIPLTPSILQSQTPLSFPSPPILAEPPTKPLPSPTISSSSSTAMFDQTENTGTIKRQKPKTNNDTNTLEKPLKSALKTTSAYDKPQSKSSGSSLHVGIVSPSTRSGGPSSPQSVSSVSSPSPSISSVGSGSGNPIELKSILVKRTPKASQETGSSNSKYKTSDA